MIDRKTLIREYVTALRQNNASIFIGSGMSMPIFNVNWKELLRPFAKEIDLELPENACDYPFIAQAYINEGNNEKNFKNEICHKFESDTFTEFHKTIAMLPIKNYWTTNYDPLIENALGTVHKNFDKIYDNNSFCLINGDREHIVYKCHGDYKKPESIIITQNDYERYRIDSFNFTSALYSELATSTILFLGYSFSDPDINNIISTLSSINEVKQNHYMITRKEHNEKYRHQELWIKNLERYGIKTLLIDDYNEIGNIIKDIEKQYMAYKILISGSADKYDEFKCKSEAQNFIYELGYKLVENDCSGSDLGHGLKIINGNGRGVGPYLYEGIAEAAAAFDLDMANHLIMYPFPKTYYDQARKDIKSEEKFSAYREKMIDKCGAVFFIFGNKYVNQMLVNADGIKKEFDIAVSKHKYVFPIGATGYIAKELANEVLNNFEYYNGDMPTVKCLLEKLNDNDIPYQKIIDYVLQIIDIIAFNPN